MYQINNTAEALIIEFKDLLSSKESQIDVTYLTIYQLLSKNIEIFTSIIFLIENSKINAAEILYRTMFEGTVLLNWILKNPEVNTFRLRLTSFIGTLELHKENFIQRSDEYITNLKESVEFLFNEGYEKIPNFKTMLGEIEIFKPEKAYSFYKYLSKIHHSTFENWFEYFDAETDNSFNKNYSTIESNRSLQLNMLSIYLLIKNFQTTFEFSKDFFSSKIWDLETEFSQFYHFNKTL